ncbi:MAG: BLUF domain-containing protein [Planctomycetota bacterium]|nr:MAG: BLUF domain-containing protein [Planctomycetota bacterium]
MLQLIYTSEAKNNFSPGELQNLLLTARRNNDRDAITGMLLYEDGTFLQVLEGENEVIESTYQRIAADKRHHKIMLIARFEIDHRSFHDWEMGFFDASGGKLLQLPGYSNFLSKKTVELENLEDGDKAREVLLNFKLGAWHRHSSPLHAANPHHSSTHNEF